MMTTCFSVTAMIGTSVSGVIIFYIILMVIMTWGGICIHLIPDSVYTRVSSIRAAFRGGNNMGMFITLTYYFYY